MSWWAFHPNPYCLPFFITSLLAFICTNAMPVLFLHRIQLIQNSKLYAKFATHPQNITSSFHSLEGQTYSRTESYVAMLSLLGSELYNNHVNFGHRVIIVKVLNASTHFKWVSRWTCIKFYYSILISTMSSLWWNFKLMASASWWLQTTLLVKLTRSHYGINVNSSRFNASN